MTFRIAIRFHAVAGLLFSLFACWGVSAQTYTLDGKLEVTDGTTVGGDFKLSGAPLSDELGLRVLFLDDSGNVKTVNPSVVQGLRRMLAEPQLAALDCDGPLALPTDPYWMVDTGKIYVHGAGCTFSPNVGIGTNSPEALLDVAGKARFGNAELGASVLTTIGSTSHSTALAISQEHPWSSLQKGLDISVQSASEQAVGAAIHVMNPQGIILEGWRDTTRVFFVNGDGKLWSTEVHVMLAEDFPDYVFYPDYELMSLENLATFIQEHGHLPDLPPASEVAANGINLGQLTSTLVQKIEELTLYAIQLNEQVSDLTQQLAPPSTTE